MKNSILVMLAVLCVAGCCHRSGPARVNVLPDWNEATSVEALLDLEQREAEHVFVTYRARASLFRRDTTWRTESGITVEFRVPKDPEWHKSQEVVEVDVIGNVQSVNVHKKLFVLVCEPENIMIRTVE
jgi:hypothetical protein